MGQQIITPWNVLYGDAGDFHLCFGSQWASLRQAVITGVNLEARTNTWDIMDANNAVSTRLISNPSYHFTIEGMTEQMQWIKTPPKITDNMTVRQLLAAINDKLQART